MEWEDSDDFEPQKKDGSVQQHDNSALEAAIDLMEKTTTNGGSGGLCSDSHHLHSFRSVPFLLLPIYTCAGCGEKLQTYVLGGNSSNAATVQCQACGVYAHRKCAFSKQIEWRTKCSSMISNEQANVGAVREDCSDVASENTTIDEAENAQDTSACITMMSNQFVLNGLSETGKGNQTAQASIADDTSSHVSSTVLQENVVANFSRLIPTTEGTDEEHRSGSENKGPFPTVDSTSASTESPPNKKLKGGEDDSQVHSLLETSEPEQDSGMDRKRLGLATVAGSIVGGVVGVGLAGPVGGMIGVKCGQTAGMLGLLLEGSVTASVWASGITAGIAAGQHIQERHETHVLALGEGTKQRALLMVRPTIKPPEPVWDDIYQKARRSYSGSNSGLVNRLIPNESHAAKRERYEREVDIIETEEDEIAIGDKVLLLVSRILSNKESLPGHVYRKLIEAFRRRSRDFDLHSLYRERQELQRNNDSSTVASEHDLSVTTESDDQGDDERLSGMHQRRRDTHAVIKYVTTSLLLTRPGFGHSVSFTEKTATAVESLVFGEIYDLVMEEIEMEYQDRDDLLLEKIADFERRQIHGEDSMKSHDGSCFGYKSYISEGALEALHCLPQAHSAADKLRYCVVFLEQISQKFSNTAVKSVMGADSLLKMVCQHILLAKVIGINSQIAFLEEFARDEQLLRGREGYALVTLQASLHFLNSSTDFESDIFGEDSD
eukprot:jgi/Psemu1/321636/estExt_fgenesh1_pg.C_60047